MSSPPSQHWAIKTYAVANTATGCVFTLTTNRACHLEMLWTLLDPWLHVTDKKTRGTSIGRRSRYCCVATNSVFQAESGDTITHTIFVETWPWDQRRWFRFRARIANIPTPSSSSCFTHVRLRDTFYPTVGHTGCAADGAAQGAAPGHTWWYVRLCEGTVGDDTWAFRGPAMASWYNHAEWESITRAFIHFDTTLMPAGYTIKKAKVCIFFKGKVDNLYCFPKFALVASLDPDPGSIVKEDYRNLGFTPIAPLLTWAAIPSSNEWREFELPPSSFPLIQPGGVTRFGATFYPYDTEPQDPPWSEFKATWVHFWMRDQNLESSPYLKLEYNIPKIYTP